MVSAAEDRGLVVSFDKKNENTVIAPVAPGDVREIKFSSAKPIEIGAIDSRFGPFTLAFDGERELLIRDKQQVDFSVVRDGPRLVDLRLALRLGSQQGILRGCNNN